MKRIFAVIVFGVVLSCASAFADHPKGWGVGLQGVGSFGGDYLFGSGHGAVSLKAPSLPIYWGIMMGYWSDLWLGVSGDYYVIDDNISKDGVFGWYLGGGLFGQFWFGTPFGVNAGVRIPVGLSLQVLKKRLEIFLQAVPQLGFHAGGGTAFYWGVGIEGGLRVWF